MLNKYFLFQHLLDLLDRSPNGVIYISWGSMVNSNTLPSGKRSALFQSISQLKEYNFVMRWKSLESLEDKQPSNLYTFDWLPQRDLCVTQRSGLLSPMADFWAPRRRFTVEFPCWWHLSTEISFSTQAQWNKEVLELSLTSETSIRIT